MSRNISRQWLRLLSGFAIALILTACAGSPDPGSQPKQSPNDDRQYRLLTLDNEMRVLLVSDAETPKAAASLNVNVGSNDNPADRGGLAHFLEHMLFLGTEKYPDAAAYERFVAENGGYRNAYTSSEHTNYILGINAEHLPEALDRFAQFFIAPKFDADYIEREKNSVQAEYQLSLKSDSRRGQDVMREIVNPEHPFSKFSVGSLDTLADRPDSSIRDELLAFYDKYYSANQMTLVVLGRESLDELESLVVPMFSPVPNKSRQVNDIPAPLFVDGTLPAIVRIEPRATLRTLSVMFPAGDYRPQYDVKPMNYVGNLVGHEGQGSLLSQLKAEGLAEGLAAGSQLGWRGGSMFGVNITLTEKGMGDYERVLQLLFAYLDMLREQPPREWLYDEQAQLAALSFRFKENGAPSSYVTGLSTGMHFYRPDDTLQGPYVMRRFDAAMINEILAAAVPENALVLIENQAVKTDRVSNYYQVPYAIAPVSEPELERWITPVAEHTFSLPQANEFIADDVSLVALDPANPELPELALEQGRKRIWFQQDEKFRLPRGAMYINFRSAEVGVTPQQTASAVLYTALLKDLVNEYAYPARLAGLNYSLYKHAQGISLRVNGYSDKQFLLLDELLQTIASPDFEQDRFDNIRKDMIISLENSVAKPPYRQVMDDLRESLLHSERGEQALIEVLQDMKLQDVVAYADTFWRAASADALVFGNYTRGDVQELSRRLDRMLAQTPAPALPNLHVTALQPGEASLLAVDVEHDDAVLAWYLQGAGDSWQDRAATALTAQVMKSGFYHLLRTEQQLGYLVDAFAWSQMDVPGLVMLIQSPVADASALADEMDGFLGALEETLDEEQFQRHRTTLVNEILKPEKNMWELAEFYWQSIGKKRYDFSGRKQLAQAVEELTLEEWTGYFRQVFIEQRRSLQVVAPGRFDKFPAGESRRFNSAEELKASHGVYVIP